MMTKISDAPESLCGFCCKTTGITEAADMKMCDAGFICKAVLYNSSAFPACACKQDNEILMTSEEHTHSRRASAPDSTKRQDEYKRVFIQTNLINASRVPVKFSTTVH